MKYASVCSGIEAPSLAWEPLGWEGVFFSEIEPFPNALLEYRYPNVPNLGDMTSIGGKIDQFRDQIDVFIGGTPCQSFSIAGLRGGLDDARGNLALQFMLMVGKLRPSWVVWENVPGVLSSNGGRDFGAIVGALSYLGYGWAYRVMDAQFYGVPQRRRRVFLVGHIGADWRGPAAVLFERESLQRNPAKGKRSKQEASTPSGSGTDDAERVFAYTGAGKMREGWGTLRADGGGGSERGGHIVASYKRRGGYGYSESLDVTSTLESQGGSHQGGPDYLPMVVESYALDCRNHEINEEVSSTIQSKGTGGFSLNYINPVLQIPQGIPDGEISHSLRAEGADASEDGTGRGTPLVVAFDYKAQGSERTEIVRQGDYAQVLANRPDAVMEYSDSVAQTLKARDYKGAGSYRDGSIGACQVVSGRVRRLMPVECERLQGMPDNYTLIPWRKGMAPDTPRYKAIGNSMAVPVVRRIGERIQFVDDLLAGLQEEEVA